MTLVLIFAAALWGLGWVMGVPKRSRWLAIGALYLGVLLIQAVLPAPHPLREATGGTLLSWLLLGGVCLLIAIYARGLRWLRARARPQPTAVPDEPAQAVPIPRESWSAMRATSFCANSAGRGRRGSARQRFWWLAPVDWARPRFSIWRPPAWERSG